MQIRELMHLKRVEGTPEWLYYKWLQKFWKAYPEYSGRGTGEPPSFFRKEFIKDALLVAEKEIQKVAPERCLLDDAKT